MPNKGYRKPNATRSRYTFAPTVRQRDLLEKHRFPDELTQPLYNRLLKELAQAIATGIDPSPPQPDRDLQLEPQTFWVDPAVETFIQSHWQGEDPLNPKRGEKQRTIAHLLSWSALRKPTGAIVSASEALALLSRWRGQRIPTGWAIGRLTEQCAEKWAIAWLLELESAEKVKLVQVMPNTDVARVVVGDRRIGFVEVLTS